MITINKLAHVLRRAVSGMRRRPWLYSLSVVTLAAAFLSFAATLTAALNLDALLARWVGSAELTVYLGPDATEEDLGRLSGAIADIEGVARVEEIPPRVARDRFAEDLGEYGEAASALPASAFPASLDVHLDQKASRDQKRRHDLAARLSGVELVEEVEVYDGWFERLSAISLIGRLAAWGLGLLALVVAVLVVAAAVRAGVAARRREVEVLRMVGATRTYVRLPFLIEGAIEAAAAMALAILALDLLMSRVETLAGDILPLVGAGGIVRLSPVALATMVICGVATGLVGARLSLRRLEEA